MQANRPKKRRQKLHASWKDGKSFTLRPVRKNPLAVPTPEPHDTAFLQASVEHQRADLR